MFHSRFVVWLLGLVVAAGAGFGAFYQLRPSPDEDSEGAACTDGDCCDDQSLTLKEEEREYLWNIEHQGNVLVRYGFGPLAAALRQASAPTLLTLLDDDFQGQALREPREVAWRTDWLTAVRQMDGGKPPLALNRNEFVERLLDYRRLFHKEPKVKLSLMKLSPMQRGETGGLWEGTCQLRLWGEKAPGEPAEVIAYLRYRIPKPTEQRLKVGGWLSACSIEQSHVGQARHFLLREAAAERGINVEAIHDSWKTERQPGDTGGVFLCDFDRDGILDMLITDVNGYWLYKGLPGGKFRDVTVEMGLPTRPPMPNYAPPAAFIDIDGDGWDDLILGQSVYKNEGGKHFTNVTAKCNLALPIDGIGFAVADFDRDGRLDVYITRNANGKADSWLEGKNGKQEGNFLWRNLGGWRFENVTKTARAEGGNRSTFSAVWFDANNDGWPDLYVPNEFGNGVLLVNQGDGTFKERSLSTGPCDFGTMALTVGDVDNDGNIDLYMANMYSKAGSRVIGNLRPDTYPPDVMAKIRTFVTGSELHRNLGDLKFEQKGHEWQVNDCGWAYGAALIDLDNDGWLDLYATAGYVSRDRDKPDG
ncbi:MAG TPA: VCBS repeat-containing protein [Gemmataceae bacterium]|nr:VCBS repeat-containing protein [Gemmataceae bacterium]